eukprot:g6809.t1
MSSIVSTSPTKKVFKHLFVYGTLKTGYTNYNRYLRYAKQLGRATLVGPAITKGKYAMVLRPPNRLPNTRGPVLMKKHQEDETNWHHIQGELWKVDEITIKALDILEGVNDGNKYYHENIQVIYPYKNNSDYSHNNDGKIIDNCTCYFYTTPGTDDELFKITPLLKSYDDNEHNKYIAPKDVNKEILKTIYNDTISCQRCRRKYVKEYNDKDSCRHHSESFAGETKQRWQLPGDTDGSAEIHFFYSCCGNYDKDSEGCHVSRHVSYDEDDTILYKDYD